MKKIICTLITILFVLTNLQAAFLTNVPRILIQPNGDTLRCFASGDEFYVRLHDANNYTIVQDPRTGYFVYGVKNGGEVVPSSWIAGIHDPNAKGLIPGLCISKENYQQRRHNMMAPAYRERIRDENTNHGNLNNIVIFIRFADDSTFANNFSHVQQMFNDTSNNYMSNSMFNYFKRTSYDQLFIRSYLYPAAQGDSILSYQDTFPRSYFQPWSETNLCGYHDGEQAEREHALLERACAYIESMIPQDVNFDYNNDNYIDNVCFIIKGDVGDWNTLLWPHRWALYSSHVFLHGKRVYDYNLQLYDNQWYFNNSVLCHEMFHSLGAPDLYRYYDDSGIVPCGEWDLMAQNQNPPQQTCAYMKYKYGNWLRDEDMILIDQSGTYTLMPLNSNTADRVCYRISTQNPFEFILADYRSKTEPFDEKCPSRGVVFYRVNTLFNGNAGYNGIDNFDEIYIFRANGSLNHNGILNGANFRGNILRNEFSPNTNPYPFLSSGETVPIHITNFTSDIDSIQFDFSDWVSVSQYNNLAITTYPNPANSVLTVETTNADEYTFQIFNIQGQLLMTTSSSLQKTNLSIAHLPSGYYFLTIKNKRNPLKTLKFIKQ